MAYLWPQFSKESLFLMESWAVSSKPDPALILPAGCWCASPLYSNLLNLERILYRPSITQRVFFKKKKDTQLRPTVSSTQLLRPSIMLLLKALSPAQTKALPPGIRWYFRTGQISDFEEKIPFPPNPPVASTNLTSSSLLVFFTLLSS